MSNPRKFFSPHKSNNQNGFDQHISEDDSDVMEELLGNTPELIRKNSDSKLNGANQKNNSESSTREFCGNDFKLLCENEHFRYLNNNTKIGAILITKNELGQEVAYQYAMPELEQSEALPSVRPLEHIQKIERYKSPYYRAYSPGLTPMYAKRFIDIEFGEGDKKKQGKIATFSPSFNKKEPFWGSYQSAELYKGKMKKVRKEELKKEMEEIGEHVKGGDELIIDPESVKKRDEMKSRGKSQNQIMGMSAKEAYENFLEVMMDDLHSEMKKRLKRAIDAPLHQLFKSNYRPEWLHAEGFSLTPMNKDPQVKENLGAAPKWANTEMMVLERIVKWFALNQPEVFSKIKPKFEMLLDTEIIKKIHFEVTLEDKKRFVKLMQEIDPFQKHPLFRKPTDLAQSTSIVHHLLRNHQPISEMKITDEHDIPNKPMTLSVIPSHILFSESKEPHHMKSHRDSLESYKINRKKVRFNDLDQNTVDYSKSVVQLNFTSQSQNYDEPYFGGLTYSGSGTGLVIENEGKLYVLTNAHCAENLIYGDVRFVDDKQHKFEVTPKCIAYQVDLALLEIADPKFIQLAQPIKLGEMVRLKDKVQVVGFPMGGNEVSITKGIVSRIEVGVYAESSDTLLQVQIDAAINSGNSGGPVFMGNQVVGIAFQSDTRGESLGYMIPTPVIKRFLKEALNPNVEFRGLPTLPIAVQLLDNPYLCQKFGLKEHESGIKIKSIDPIGTTYKKTDAFCKLKENDILLEIDGLPISNEGTVDIPGIGNCIDMDHVTQMKLLGDTVKLKVLRDNKRFEVDVILDTIYKDTHKVPVDEHDKSPSYYINSGVCFVPMTSNYLQECGSELGKQIDVKTGRYLENTSKESPGDQIIVIKNILDCKETQGYAYYTDEIVKEVNGKPIDNMKSLIEVLESNKNSIHDIITSSKKDIAIKNMSQSEHEKLLKRYRIAKHVSEDLQIFSQLTKENDGRFIDLDSSTELVNLNEEHESKPLILKRHNAMMTFDHLIEKNCQNNPTVGMTHFLNTIEAMEQRYNHSDSDDEFDFDKISENENNNDMEYSDSDEDFMDDHSSEQSSEEDISDEESFDSPPLRQYQPQFFSHKRKGDDGNMQQPNPFKKRR